MNSRPSLAGPIERLVEQLSRLPGIGKKTATRLAFHILKGSDDYARELGQALIQIKDSIHPCQECGALTDLEVCAICSDPRRDRSLVCAVAGTSDVMAIEGTGSFPGIYHVLGGVLSPLDGVGPDDLCIGSLLKRVASGAVTEIVIALSPSVDGEATAHYLVRVLGPHGVKVSRIASGIPMGGDLEWTDSYTLARAMQDRRSLL